MQDYKFLGRLLVICPHFDDACFSLGGFLLKGPSESVTILTVFSKSQHAPNYKFFYPFLKTNNALSTNPLQRFLIDSISIIRKKEDSEFCHQIGAIQGILPFEDSSARRCPAYNPIFDKTKIDKSTVGNSVFETIEKWVFSGAFDSLLCPLGIGNQVDHLIVLNAMLRMLKTKQTPKLKIYFYEDLPYAAFYELDVIDSLACERIGSNNAEYVDVTKEMVSKQKLIDIYHSQGQKKAPFPQHAKRLFAQSSYNTKMGFYERLWRFCSR